MKEPQTIALTEARHKRAHIILPILYNAKKQAKLICETKSQNSCFHLSVLVGECQQEEKRFKET